MAKLSLRQIDSLIESSNLNEEQLKDFVKDGYDSKDIEEYFISKIKEQEELSKEEYDDGNDTTGNTEDELF